MYNTKYNIDLEIDKALYENNDTDQHGITLLAICCSIRAKNVLELGVRYGGTTRPLLKAMQITGGKLTSVDIMDHGYRPEPELQKYWDFNLQDALSFLEQNQNQKYDLIFIDDLHTTEHLYKELLIVDKMASKETVILLHDLMYTKHPEYNVDIMPPGNEFEGTGPHGGLMKFLEGRNNYEYATIPVCHGLTLLRKFK